MEMRALEEPFGRTGLHRPERFHQEPLLDEARIVGPFARREREQGVGKTGRDLGELASGTLTSGEFPEDHFRGVNGPPDSLDNDTIERDDVLEALGVSGVGGEGDSGSGEEPAGPPEPMAASDSHT